jgi:Cu+-exporting ATPase
VEALVQAHNAGGSATDPVCGMAVDAATTQHRHTHHGHATPSARPAAAASSPPIQKNIWEKRRSRRPRRRRRARSIPARCIRKSARSDRAPARFAAWRSSPKRAARMTAANERRHDPALLDRPRLTLPVLLLEMGGHFGTLRRCPTARRTCSSCLATPVVLWAAGRSSCAARNRSSRAISICSRSSPWAPASAYVYSVVATLAPGSVSSGLPRCTWRHGALFRGRGHHHRAGAARASAGTARPRLDGKRDPRADRR